MKVSQFTFGGGQINRGLIGRRDLQKYYQGAFDITNFIVKRHGTLEMRHGFEDVYTFAGGVTAYRIIPFQGDNTSCNYVVFCSDGIYFFDRVGDFLAKIDTPYSEMAAKTFEYLQSGDTIFIASRYVKPKRLRRVGNSLVLDDMPFDDYLDDGKAPTMKVNTAEWKKADSSRKRSIRYKITEVVGGKEIRTSEEYEYSVWMPPSEGSYSKLTLQRHGSEADFEGFNIYRNDGSGWGYIGTTVDNNAETNKQSTAAFTSPGSWSGGGGKPHSVYTGSVTVACPKDEDGEKVNWRPNSLLMPFFSDAAIKGFFKEGTGDMAGYLEDVKMVDLVIRLSATCGEETIERVTFGSGFAPSSVSTIVNRDKTLTSYEERLNAAVSMVKESVNNWEAMLGFSKASQSDLQLTITLDYYLGPDEEGVHSGLEVVLPGAAACEVDYDIANTATWTGTFIDDYIQIDYSRCPVKYRQPFKSAYPGVVGLYQQRMIWGSTLADPSMFWMSVPGDLSNFSVHPNIQEDDMINAALPLTRGPRILHCVSHKYLVFLCENSECVVNSGSEGLSYKTIRSEQQSFMGTSERVRPLLCGNAILFCDRAGASVREYKYDYAMDAMAGRDVSVLNSEAFGKAGGIVDWTYQMFPDSLVWCVMADGTLLVFCYMPEQDVYAWSRVQMPRSYSAIGIACGDALEDSDPENDDKYKMSALMVLARKGDNKYHLVRYSPTSFIDSVNYNTSRPSISGSVELVVPDAQGQFATNRKRLLTAFIRGKNLTRNDAGTGTSALAIDREDKTGEGAFDVLFTNCREEGQILSAQLRGDWGVDSRLVIECVGNGKKAEIYGVSVSFDAQDLE